MMKYRIVLAALMLAAGCKAPFHNNLPPAAMLRHPGPGVDGPGPGVMLLGNPGPGVVQGSSQVAFVGPEGMMVNWDVYAAGAFDSEPLVAPGRFNFGQGSMYRFKLTNVPGRPGVELYPTLELAPGSPKTIAYLEHNAIPFQLTEEDFDYVLAGNFITKVIYLPDSEYQELALAGVETLVSTRLDPGVDPIVEADRRGSIMAIIRLGNKDLELPGADGMVGDGEIIQTAGYGPACGPDGAPLAANYGSDYVSGVNGAQYGMPMSGTPIGLPGPPHIPLGGPAGLKRHVMRNWTHEHIPGPTKRVAINVKQKPGMHYPKPANHAHIVEKTRGFSLPHPQPLRDKFQKVKSAPDAPPMMGDACFVSDCPPQ